MRYIKACCYWLKSLGIHCLHYAQCLFLFETNSKIKHVPNYSHRYRAEEKKTSLKKYKITQLCILYIIVSLLSRHAMLETKNGWEGDNNLLSPFLILQLWRSCDILNLDTIYYLQIHNKDRFKRKVSESIFDLVNCHGIVHIFVPGVITFSLHEINANNYFTWTGKP